MNKICTVRKEGGSRVITISKIIPEDWIIVELTKIRKTDSTITVKINKVK